MADTKPPVDPPAPPARRAGRTGLVLLLGLIAGLLALAGATWQAWRSPATLPWLLQQVPGLQVHGVRGSLADRRLQVDRLDWQLPGGFGRLQLWTLDLEATGLVLWPRPGTLAALRLARLQAARARFDSPPSDGQPVTAPVSLQLPIDLQVDRLGIDALQVDAQPAITGLQAALALGADGGSRHRVDNLRLVLDTGSADAPAPLALRGRLAIGTAAPLPVDALVEADAPTRGAVPAWRGRIALQGPLAELQADAVLSGAIGAIGTIGATPDTPRLQARGTVLPFAAWPLGALDLRTEALDLAALSPRLPSTRLAGRARLQTQGLDRPASLDATLDNSLPGPWDAGRLPLRRLQLQASGRPDQADRLTLQRFDLLLGDAAGPAGRVQGAGEWQGATLALRLQTEGLQPARLHRHAAPVLLDGPLTLQLRGLPTSASPAGTPVVAIDGTLTGRWTGATPAAGAVPTVQLRLAGEASARHLLVTQAEARSGPPGPDGRPALARLHGRADADGAGWRITGQATLADFDPRPWWRGADGSAWRRGPHRLQAEADARLLWRPAAGPAPTLQHLLDSLQGSARLTLGDSLLAGVPLRGDASLRRDGPAGTARLQASLTVGGNRIDLQADAAAAVAGRSQAAPAADRWSATLQASDLATLAPLRPLLAALLPASAEAIDAAWPSAGQLQATLQAQGRWPALQSEGSVQVTALATPSAQLQQASLRWRQGAHGDAPLQIDLEARDLRSGNGRLDALSLSVSGTLAEHQIRLRADSPLRPPAWTTQVLGPTGTGSQLSADARGQWLPGTSAGARPAAGPSYRLRALALNGGARAAGNASAPWLSAQGLAATLQLDNTLAPQSLQLAPGRLQLPGTALRWREAGWTAAGDGLLVFNGTLESIDAAALMRRLQPDMGWTGDLALDGQIDLRRTAGSLDLDLQLVRSGGDLATSDDLGQRQALGLSELRLVLGAHGGRWQFAHGLVGRRIGSLVGAVELRNTPGSPWPQAGSALQGLAEARVADLGVWGTWVPPGWRLSGAMDAVLQFGGTLGAPRLTGSMRGSGLGVRNLLEGVSLTDGELALALNGDDARIERLHFAGGDGRLDITGGATLGAQPRLALQLAAERFRVLGRLDRRVVASGQGRLALAGRQLQVDGDFRIDEGLLDIGRGDAPTLDADVRVRRGADAGAAAPMESAAAPPRASTGADPVQVRMQVKVDLGNRLQLRGQGVETRLRGGVVLGSSGSRLTVNGTVTTEEGRYAAYGQKLEITRGRFVFSGEPGNPRLDVLAVRPNLDVLVGVLVDGTAQNPRIRLYSEPDLADYDKLSWLVLGRGPDGLGSADTALLQRAAFALLSGQGPGPTDQLLQAIGLTDFSLRQTEGDTRDTIISLGRQLSRRWYVGYERGIQATTGTWQLIYRVAQRFTLRAQSGSENAVDLIWTWRW